MIYTTKKLLLALLMELDMSLRSSCTSLVGMYAFLEGVSQNWRIQKIELHWPAIQP